MEVTYYNIDEQAAKRAKEQNSFSDYEMGSATKSYRESVDKAVNLAEQQKKRVDSCFHGKIDSLVNLYAKKLAENLNERFRIDARVPSILIAGGSNFPTRKKEQQNVARDRNMKEWETVQRLLGKIQSTGMGGISADRPDALSQLEKKLERYEHLQKKMRGVNAYYRKHHTVEKCPLLTEEEITILTRNLEKGMTSQPFPTYALRNNSAEIRRLRVRMAEIKQNQEVSFCGWEFAGGEAVANKEYNRLQLFFQERPSAEERQTLRRAGFRWAPSVGAWQRQLNRNAMTAAGQIAFIRPLNGKTLSELQPKAEKRKEELSL